MELFHFMQVSIVSILLDRIWRMHSNNSPFEEKCQISKRILIKNGCPIGIIKLNVKYFVKQRKKDDKDDKNIYWVS